jgi:fructose-bisphosphate aldolase class II
MKNLPYTLCCLGDLLHTAQIGGFAVGAFSPRYSAAITPILRAGEKLRSPLIVQIAEVELQWYNLTIEAFAEQFWSQVETVNPSVPVALHLDHTKSLDLIRSAIGLGFTSVMIDASELPLDENIAKTRQVVEIAHEAGVSVEGELGRIISADQVETDNDEELYTIPEEAARFAAETEVDALAVSVGTIHGVYTVRQPRIDLERLAAIRAATDVPLVLHGGSGNPAELIHAAIRLPGGGVSKINIATDLELGLLAALGRTQRLDDFGLRTLPGDELARGLNAVQAVVEDKISNFLLSAGRAKDYGA